MKVNVSVLSKSLDYVVHIDELKKMHIDGKVAVVTNPKVSNLHLKRLKDFISANEFHVVTIPDGEQYKNLKIAENILNELFEHRFNRHSLLIALGGGVIGDITGFCAAIYERGIDFIQVPTTLLAQVDASVGGKTAVNNKYGKNLIGAFHQPRAVYCQSEFLKTLPKREFNSGVAEIIKMATVLDKDFFEWLEINDLRDNNNLPEAITKSVGIKARVVAKDEKEQGVRAVLNYGHTFAHVIEKMTSYRTFFHGEAVSIGINMANHLAMELELLTVVEHERVCELLQRYELPLSYHIGDMEKFYELFFLDKKSLDDNVMFILPEHIGSYAMMDSISKETIFKVLRKFS